MKTKIVIISLMLTACLQAQQPALTAAVQKTDFDAVVKLLQNNPAQNIREEALALANKVIEEKKKPLNWKQNYKGLAQTALGAGLTALLLYAMGENIQIQYKENKRRSKPAFEDLDFRANIFMGMLSGGSYYLYHCGRKELALPHHRDYAKALAIESLLLKYQKPKQD